MNSSTRFKYLFWFCVYVFTLGFTAMMLLLFIEIPERNREQAANTQGFLQGSLIMSAVGFLLTGSIALKGNTANPAPQPGTIKMNLTAETTDTETKPDKDENNGGE